MVAGGKNQNPQEATLMLMCFVHPKRRCLKGSNEDMQGMKKGNNAQNPPKVRGQMIVIQRKT